MDINNARVLHISKYYYPFLGGIEQVARDVLNALKDMDSIEQKMICFNEDAQDGTYVCKRSETVHDYVDGIEVIRCGCFAKVASQSLSFSYFGELRELFKDFKPDIVVFHYPNPFVTSFLLTLLPRKTKLVVYWHLDITKQKMLGKLFHGQNLRLIKRADKILGATPKHVNESAYSPYFGDKKYILPYMIDECSLVITESEIKAAEDIRNKYAGQKIGFYIGRHAPQKGLNHLIEASKIIGDSNVHFFVAGSGELTAQLKEEAKTDKKVEFIGRVSDSEKRIYLQACDFFCFPSVNRSEAFGLALAEAMYFGKPAVTFTIPGSGVNYVNLNGITGIESPNGDSSALALSIKKLTDDNEFRTQLGINARKRVLDNFTRDAFGKNLKKLINEL